LCYKIPLVQKKLSLIEEYGARFEQKQYNTSNVKPSRFIISNYMNNLLPFLNKETKYIIPFTIQNQSIITFLQEKNYNITIYDSNPQTQTHIETGHEESLEILFTEIPEDACVLTFPHNSQVFSTFNFYMKNNIRFMLLCDQTMPFRSNKYRKYITRNSFAYCNVTCLQFSSNVVQKFKKDKMRLYMCFLTNKCNFAKNYMTKYD